jgi:ribonuclease Z
MEIVFLGTGGTWPSPRRNVSAIGVRMGSEVLLLDCGEGTQRQLMMSPLSFMKITKVLITHFHGDHFLGLGGLVQSMHMNEREEELVVYGPRGIGQVVDQILHLGHFRAGFQIRTVPMQNGSAEDCGGYWIRAANARHNVPALAYRIEEKERPGRFNRPKAEALGIPAGPLYRRLQQGESVTVSGQTFRPEDVLGPPRRGRSLVYTGDTLPSDEMVEFARDCDVLIHDATVDGSLEERGNEYGHSSSRQAAEIAKRCGAGKLFLTHLSPRYEDPTPVLDSALAVFEKSEVAEDFLEYRVPMPE